MIRERTLSCPLHNTGSEYKVVSYLNRPEKNQRLQLEIFKEVVDSTPGTNLRFVTE